MTSRKRFDQILVSASRGDAISGMAFATERWLRSRFDSNIHVAWPDESVSDRVRSLEDLNRQPLNYPVLYHASYGLESIRKTVEQREGFVCLMYHNVTPTKYFEKIDPEFAVGLDFARREVIELRPKFGLVLAASAFSAKELMDVGYRDVHVLPIGLDVMKLARQRRRIDVEMRLRDRFPSGYVIAIAQLLPHKAVEDIVTAVSLLRTVRRERVGLVVVGTRRSGIYSKSLADLADRLLGDAVHFTGPIDDAELATYMANARCYVSASKHEGLGIPLLEAMAMGVPAVVRDAAAVAETAADAAMVVPPDGGAEEIASAVTQVLQDPGLARQLREKGRVRAGDFSLAAIMTRFDELLCEVGI
jgi:glycosyltransferase involved in cell wall biosynthesis